MSNDRGVRSLGPLVLVLLAGTALRLATGTLPLAAQSSADGVVPAPAPASHVPRRRPRLEVPRASGPIEIDGRLDDAGWEEAARADGFTETWPGDLVAPPVATVVWVTYDDARLYVAFEAFDDPMSVRAALRDRDEIWNDDFVSVMLDTYGNGEWGYHLAANALGVQGDTRLGPDADGDGSHFDVVYASAGRVTADGYVVEFAIPFSSLRFPAGDELEWRVDFYRYHPRDRGRSIRWAAIERSASCALCVFGTLVGLEGVEPGGGLELFPSLLARQAADRPDAASGLEGADPRVEPSLGARYAFTDGLTLEATANPDFSQVESDAARIDVNTTFALFFPERRPFFQEGSDLFDSRIRAIYTRSINDPQVAAKVVRRSGATSISYLGARDLHTPILLPFEERSFVGEAGASLSNIVRLRHAVGEGSWLGALVTDRRLEGNGGSGTTFGIDGLYRLGSSTRLEFQALASRTAEPADTTLTRGVNDVTFDRGTRTAAFDGERFGGHGAFLGLIRDGRHWDFDLRYESGSPGFRTDNGFETRNDYRRVFLHQELAIFPALAFVDRIGPGLDLSRAWNFAGVRKRNFVNPYVQVDLAGQTFLAGGVWWESERFRSIDFDDVFGWVVRFDRVFGEALSVGGSVGGGREIARALEVPALARSLHFDVRARIQPFSRLVVEPSVAYAELAHLDGGEEIFAGAITRARTQIQLTRRAFLRLVTEYDEFDRRLVLEPLFTYRLDPFSFFFVGASYEFEDSPTGPTAVAGASDGRRLRSRQLFAKFQYLLDF